MRRYVGERGEEEILRYLITLPGVQIDHVASWSDAYGYDIAVLGAMRECHLEVKSTTRANRLTLHLSRNEFETMKADEAWHLVAVVLDQELRLARVYAIARDWIQSCAPADTALGARWDSAKFDVPQAACTPGIPALAPFLSCEDSPLLVGRTVASSAWSLSAYPDRRLSVYLRWRAQMMQALNAIVRMVGLGELSCCAAIACCCLNRLKNLARTARASPRARRPQHLLRVLERA
ncbi:protein NO VEIN domain-containing protein [Sinomonas atrocyanea]|uniref:protein NO VEIN domain-containing protein n=1 Tax=Sinomonas atrocyanea TaxID=37927 RepID=UPI0037D9D3CE